MICLFSRDFVTWLTYFHVLFFSPHMNQFTCDSFAHFTWLVLDKIFDSWMIHFTWFICSFHMINLFSRPPHMIHITYFSHMIHLLSHVSFFYTIHLFSRASFVFMCIFFPTIHSKGDFLIWFIGFRCYFFHDTCIFTFAFTRPPTLISHVISFTWFISHVFFPPHILHVIHLLI